MTILPSNVAPQTSQPSALVRLDCLSKVYTEGNQRRTVIDELSGGLYEGEFVCLLGKSGSGKSTLLNLISGIDTPSSGHVYIRKDDQEIAITGLNDYQRTRFRRCHIGIVFQFF
jgi:putative ABC transport system ATP-binding protein